MRKKIEGFRSMYSIKGSMYKIYIQAPQEQVREICRGLNGIEIDYQEEEGISFKNTHATDPHQTRGLISTRKENLAENLEKRLDPLDQERIEDWQAEVKEITEIVLYRTEHEIAQVRLAMAIQQACKKKKYAYLATFRKGVEAEIKIMDLYREWECPF